MSGPRITYTTAIIWAAARAMSMAGRTRAHTAAAAAPARSASRYTVRAPNAATAEARHRSRSSVSDSGTVRFGGQVWSAAWQASAYAARSPRRVPLPLLVLGGEDGERVLDLLAAGGLPADEPLVDPGDLHDRAAAGRHLPRFPRPPEPG
ncbi:hypothetical protein [Streptomyces sp. NBC_01278]|uniref:hypothetical protein n=1 Tax=Streptomyces sp. NBC_01278 TaxID=2903809 RepID=UPI003FCC3CD7